MIGNDNDVRCSVFVGVSLDGFIARPNGDLGWLMGEGGGDSAECGYNEFIAGIDAIVMGRKTFEKVLSFDKWYYGNKRVIVLSHHPLDLSVAQARGGVVARIEGLRQRLCRVWLLLVRAVSTWIAEARFRSFCAPGSYAA